MSKQTDNEQFLGFGHQDGEKVEPEAVALLINPNLPSRVALAISSYISNVPLCVYLMSGTLRDYVLGTIAGVYYTADFPRQNKIGELFALIKECVLTMDDKDRHRAVGFTRELYNFYEYANMSSYKPFTDPTGIEDEGARLVCTDEEKEIVTSTQYTLKGDLTNCFDITWCPGGDVRKIRLKIKPGVDPEKRVWNPQTY